MTTSKKSLDNKLYGLVVCGGKSTRMGQDKSLINYRGKPQRYNLYELMQSICDDVFISCNKQQAVNIEEDYKKIVDAAEYNDIGPMAALLTAVKSYSNASFVLIGCDYPFLNKTALDKLVTERDENKDASCFYNHEDLMIEPLLCIYEPSTYKALNQNFHEGQYSLRRLLDQSDIKKITPDKIEWIKSIDTREEYEQIKAMI